MGILPFPDKYIQRVAERHREQILGIVHLRGVRDVFLVHGIREETVPVLVLEKFSKLGGIVTHGIQTSQQTTYARAAHQVHRYAQLLQVHQRPDLGSTLRAASGEHQTHCGTLFPLTHLVHLSTYLGQEDAVKVRSGAVHRQTVGVCLGTHPRGTGDKNCYDCECCPASIPQAASISSPLDERMVHIMPLLLSLSRNSSIFFSDEVS